MIQSIAITMIQTAVLAATGPGIEAARSFRSANEPTILNEFAQLLAIPNVSGDLPSVQRNAEFIVHAFSQRGVKLDVLTVPNAAPIVVGEIRAPGASRTIGIYVHYDGQPVDAERWTNSPWTPTLYTGPIDEGGARRPLPKPGERVDPEWRLYARSAGDDKAPLIALLAALDALQSANIPITSNIKFLFEGEEEAGSIHLGDYFAKYGEQLKADVWLICDGPVHQSRRPQLVFGVRGVTSLEITVYGANRFLHSGHYGNWSPNPALMLAKLLASMKDESGRVAIEGFYEDVQPLSSTERAALEEVPNVDDQLRSQFGLAGSEMDGTSLAESLLLPSLNIKGFESGAVGAKARNVIPSTATAALDIRLVKDNDPQTMLDRVEVHIQKQGYVIVRDSPDDQLRRTHRKIARITRGAGYRAARSSMDLPIVQPLLETARQAIDDDDVILMPSLGGSLPLYLFEEMLGTPTIIVPIANHDNNQHGPDENIRLANLWYGIDLMAGILTMQDFPEP
ncbi:MAG: M20/M25/M40 family metallo-hydrolase [Phycisphaerales bacterium]